MLPIQRIAYKEEVPYRRCGRVEWAGKFSSKFSGLSETVPDTHYTIFTRVKIGKSIGVYSGVYEYTQEIPGINTEYTEYTRYLGIS